MKFRLTRTLHLLTALLLVITLTACGGGESGTVQDLPQNQLDKINQASTSINEKLSSYSSPGSTEALQEAKTFAATLPAVEYSEIVDGNLLVQYKDAGQEIWILTTPVPEPPADLVEMKALAQEVEIVSRKGMKSQVGSEKAVLINALKDDVSFDYDTERLADIKRVLEGLQFDVEVFEGEDASPENLRALSDCSVIVYLGHGANYVSKGITNPYTLQTGKPWDSDKRPFADWVTNRIIKVTVPWGKEKTNRSFYGVTGRFWKDSYKHSRFKNAIFLNCACSSANEGFYNNLFDIGISAYTGWTKPTNKGSSAAYRILAIMARGKSLQQAFDMLPIQYKRFDFEGVTTELKLFPTASGSFTLGSVNTNHPEVVIWAPFQGENISDRQCTVRGQIIPFAGYENSSKTIAVNGVSFGLEVDSEGRFEQPIGLREGENTITVSVFDIVNTSATVGINGIFTQDVLFTSLWWNTDISDIDLHLVPIEGADGARDDCFYGHMISTWGATLDVDDTDGYGPEHITARTLPAGKYLLYVHYYDTHGQTSPTVVNVAVSTNGQQSEIYSLGGNRRMAAEGDIWNVCTIEFPSGKISSINEFLPAAKSGAKLTRIPRGKNIRLHQAM